MARKKILFLTNSEFGQANVFFAVVYELLLLRQYEVHIASFAPLKDRVHELNTLVPDNDCPVQFHTIFGPCMIAAFELKNKFMGPFRPSIKGSLDTFRHTLPVVLTAWDDATYIRAYEDCVTVIQSVQPDLIVVDNLLSQALDACKTLSRNYVVLSPNTYQEICHQSQSTFRQFCRYPAIVSGLSYPIPWYTIPANIFLRIMAIWYIASSSMVRNFMSYRKAHNLPSAPPMFSLWQEKNQYLIPSTPEIDFPVYIPPNVIGCGPILLPFASVAETDEKLQTWLERGPTVMVNLGTLVRIDDAMARELASGMKIVLDTIPDVQILWKLRRSGGWAVSSDEQAQNGFGGGAQISEEALGALAKYVDDGRVKIVDWLAVPPLAILETGLVVCAVHHGGSNSFHEALSAGVPQVVVPCWLDTIDFAERAEWLGIGVYGSRSSAPSAERHEFSRAILKVLGNSVDATRMRQKAKEMAKIGRKAGGRKKAAEMIIERLEKTS